MTTTTDTDTWTSIARAIVRCATCKLAHRVDFTTTTTTRAYEGRMSQSRTVNHNGREARYHDRYDLQGILTRGFTCTKCGNHGATFKVVQGSYSESVKCGAKCRNAVGPSCECQCGGENHASGHAAV